MSFTISKKDFFDLLQKASPVSPAKSSIQIISNVKMKSSENIFELSATDLDQSIRAFCPVETSSAFEIAINSRKIFDIVREMPDGTITGEIEENVLTLKSEKGFSCKISGADVQDFPEFPVVNEQKTFSISKSLFQRLVLGSSFAVSKDTSRSCLCGVLLEVDKKVVRMVATDGHRLGCAVASGIFDVSEKISSIVSPKTLLHLCRIFNENEGEENISVSIDEKYISFKTEKFIVCSKLIEGPYPDYEKVIPKVNPKKVEIERAEIINAVRRVSVLSNQKTHLVKFNFSEASLEIVVLNRDIGGEAREVIQVMYKGDDHAIGLNAQFLTEILSIIDTQQIVFEMNTQISACLIFPKHEKDKEAKTRDLFLIMPLRIMDEIQ